MAITSIGQIHISVTDLDRAITFYRDVLGLAFLFRVPGQPMAFFDVGGVRLYLGRPEDPSFASAPLLYLTVDDLDAEYGRLRGLAVDFIDEPHMVHHDERHELWMAFLRSPEGHPIGLMQERPR